MGPETEYDEAAKEKKIRTLEVSLPSPEYVENPQEINQIISEISLPSPLPMNPNTASQTIAPLNNQQLYTIKRQNVFRDKDIFFAIKWACGILTVAASIVFGIWAPLSYEATLSDNDTQNSIASVLSNATDLASTANIIASDAASAQHEAMALLHSTIGLMAQLAVMQFCHGQQTLSPCSSYLQEADGSLGNLIERLGHGTVVTTGTESAAPPTATADPQHSGAGAAPPPAPPNMAGSGLGVAAPPSAERPTFTSLAAPQSASTGSRLPMDAVLGIVFSVIGIGGAMLGFVVWRIRRRRLMLRGE